MPSFAEGQPISDLMGMEFRGWDLNEPLADTQVRDICRLLYRYALLCFRGQSLTPANLAKFGERLGEPIQHNEANLRLEQAPSVMVLSNADERDDRQLNGGSHWHTDLIYTDRPASFTMLNAVAVPMTGGGTMFANQVAAYDALSASRRREIEDYVVIHCYEGRTDGSMPTVRHPLVHRHPVTGRKALYGAWDTGIGVEGMPDEEGRQFLAEMARHATSERFVYLHKYSINDLVIWDNALLLHSGEMLQRARAANERRIMHRVSVHGWPDT
jgi:taurine dioxygenase